jgi:hypothetical protein
MALLVTKAACVIATHERPRAVGNIYIQAVVLDPTKSVRLSNYYDFTITVFRQRIEDSTEGTSKLCTDPEITLGLRLTGSSVEA